jgi:hypothetical protein
MIPSTTRTSPQVYAKFAGIAFLLYIAADITGMAPAGQNHVTAVLSLLGSFSALVLAVTLYMITHEQGPALAMLALTCRVVESISFAVGSTLFCWLLLRGRMIPTVLAWLGVIASILLVVILPLQLAGLFGGPATWSASVTLLVWLPMLVFEITLALWLLIKGVALPATQATPL